MYCELYFLCTWKVAEMLRRFHRTIRAYHMHLKWQSENHRIIKYLIIEETIHCARCCCLSHRNLLKVIRAFTGQIFLKYLLCTNPYAGCWVYSDEKHRQDSCPQEAYGLGVIMA